MNKITISGNYWYKIIGHYQNLLHENFPFQPLTPVIRKNMEVFFDNAVRIAKSKETHPAWHVPLKLNYDLAKNIVIIEPVNPLEINFI